MWLYDWSMLLERDGYLETLSDRLDTVRSGEGALVLVAGEAGVGKTALVDAFVSGLGGDILITRGQCDPLTTPRALGPIHDVVADGAFGLGGVALTDDPTEMFAEILDRLSNSIRPIVLVLEDVHWADGGTLDFLRYLGRRVESTRALVICTYRDDEVGQLHPLRPVLGQLIPRPAVHRIKLDPLSAEATRALAEGSRMDTERLHRVTGGNAFFVTEAVAAGDLIPASAQDAVLARVGRLSAAAQRVVRAVSVSPRPIHIATSIRLAGVHHEAVDEALDAGVLVAIGPDVRFRHEIARVAVEQSLPGGSRVALNEAMLGLLLEDDPPDPSLIAHHAIAAGDGEKVAEFAPIAGDEARLAGAGREAVAFYEAALSHRTLLEDADEARVEYEYGWLLARQMRHREAQDALERAVDLYEELGDTEMTCRALVRLQSPTWVLDSREAALGVTDRALALARDRGSPEAEASVLYRIAHNNMVDRNRDGALEAAAASLEIAEQVGNVEEAWRAGLMVGCVQLVMGDADTGAELVRQKVDAARELGRSDLEASALGMLGTGAGEVREYQLAVSALEATIALSQAVDDDANGAYSVAWLARVRFEQGRWDEALELAELVLSDDASTGIEAITAHGVRGRALTRRGEPDERDGIQWVLDRADGELFQYVWGAYCGVAEHAWLNGMDEVSAEPDLSDLLQSAHARALNTDSPWARGEVAFWLWRLGMIDGSPDGAAEPYALQMAGDWEQAAEAWEAIGCPYEVGMALLDGDTDAVARAHTIFDAIGAAPAAKIARDRLRKLGVVARGRGANRSTIANPAGLTDRQLEVLGLMVRGLSNGEIADALYVAPKTVEHHASAIYAKLAVDGRAKAVAVATEQGLFE